MKPIWDNGPLPARDVFAAIPEGHGWAYKTVKTLLSRLVAKGALEYEQVGNTYVYRAAHDRERMTAKEVRGFLDRVLDGSLSPILAHFIESKDLSDEDIARLRGMLDRKAESRGVARGRVGGDAGADAISAGKVREGKGRIRR
jgi:BlaI family penicillinase repressor